jgi:hypothetical protein
VGRPDRSDQPWAASGDTVIEGHSPEGLNDGAPQRLVATHPTTVIQ